MYWKEGDYITEQSTVLSNEMSLIHYLYLNLYQKLKPYQQCTTPTNTVGCQVGVSPPISTGDDWVSVWHRVLMQSTEASERDYQGGAGDYRVPARATECCSWMLGGSEREEKETAREGSVDMVKTTQTAVSAMWEERQGWRAGGEERPKRR